MIKTKGTGGYQIISCDFGDLTDIASDVESQKLLYETLNKCLESGKQVLLQVKSEGNVVVPVVPSRAYYTDSDSIEHTIIMVSINTDIVPSVSAFDIDDVLNALIRIVIDVYYDEDTESDVYDASVHIYTYTLTELGD